MDGPISRVHKEKTRFPSRPIIFVWQDDKADALSYEQVASAQPIKRLRSILWTNHKTKVSAQPITSFGRIILQTNRWLSQSHPSVRLSSDGLSSDGSSFGRIVGSANRKASEHPLDEPQDISFGSANHILRTDHLSYELSAQPITSFRWIILRTNLRLSQSHPSVGLSSDGLSS